VNRFRLRIKARAVMSGTISRWVALVTTTSVQT
jgi:hypothetical protein